MGPHQGALALVFLSTPPRRWWGWESGGLRDLVVPPLPTSPEILIFFTVLLVLLVTWTLTLMGSPW